MSLLAVALISFIIGYKAMPTPEPVQVIIDHNVEVSVPCKITIPTKPVMPLTDTATKEEDIFVKSQKAIAEIELRRGYEDKLESAAGSCK